MHFYIKKQLLWPALFFALALQACNKEFDDTDTSVPVSQKPGPIGTATLADVINTDTSFSFLKAAVTKAGLTAVLGNNTARLTLFAPDNAAFRRSGIPAEAVITQLLDAATLRGLVSYHLVPDYLPAASIPTTFPNLQYATLLNPRPDLSPLLRLTIFPSRRSNGAWVNNTPITAADVAASNGVLHRVAAVVAPPTKSIYDTITRDTSLTFLVAALNRADSGKTAIADGSLIEASKSIGANLTLFAPDNAAFRALLTAMQLPPSPAVFAALPVATVRGLIAYHLLPSRAFSVNMPTTPTAMPTLLNSAVTAHPGVRVSVAFTGPVVTTFTVLGFANSSAASVLQKDVHATNGVIHKIDQVLRPQ